MEENMHNTGADDDVTYTPQSPIPLRAPGAPQPAAPRPQPISSSNEYMLRRTRKKAKSYYKKVDKTPEERRATALRVVREAHALSRKAFSDPAFLEKKEKIHALGREYGFETLDLHQAAVIFVIHDMNLVRKKKSIFLHLNSKDNSILIVMRMAGFKKRVANIDGLRAFLDTLR